MKKLIIGMSLASILALGTIAFAQGMGGWGGGNMMGQGHMGGYGMMGSGNGYGHMGPGNDGHMNGMTGQGYGPGQSDKKFLDDTADLRKELNDKRFEYAEASRNPEITAGELRKLEKQIYELETKIDEKNPRTNRGYNGY